MSHSLRTLCQTLFKHILYVILTTNTILQVQKVVVDMFVKYLSPAEANDLAKYQLNISLVSFYQIPSFISVAE